MVSNNKLGDFTEWEKLLFLEGQGADITDEYLDADKVIISDCDGILTDGGHYYDDSGKCMKRFGSCDKEAMRFMSKCGWRFLFVTSDPTGGGITKRRLDDWGVHEGYKRQIIDFSTFELVDDYFNSEPRVKKNFIRGVDWIDRGALVSAFKKKGVYTVFIGDSLSDLPAASRADLFCTVDNALDIVKENARIVSKKMGGFGGFADLMYKIHFSVGNQYTGLPSILTKNQTI
jgi:3-deoxy-D-manno-octulosonate 8-phosphate phosphatase KdsC-like HAD superfamily phosphatase